MKILVIDRSEEIRQTLRTLLERKGHEVTDISDIGGLAETVFQNFQIVMMNQGKRNDSLLSGDYVFRLCKDKLPDTGFILMSGGGFIPHSSSEKYYYFLRKPFKLEAVDEAIASFCGQPA